MLALTFKCLLQSMRALKDFLFQLDLPWSVSGSGEGTSTLTIKSSGSVSNFHCFVYCLLWTLVFDGYNKIPEVWEEATYSSLHSYLRSLLLVVILASTNWTNSSLLQSGKMLNSLREFLDCLLCALINNFTIRIIGGGEWSIKNNDPANRSVTEFCKDWLIFSH